MGAASRRGFAALGFSIRAGAGAGEAMSGALARDHQGLYEKFRNTPVPTADGKNASMFSQLPFDEQVKLSGDYRSSRTRTETARSGATEVQFALAQAAWDDPAQPIQPFADLQAMMDDAEQKGLLNPADGWRRRGVVGQ